MTGQQWSPYQRKNAVVSDGSGFAPESGTWARCDERPRAHLGCNHEQTVSRNTLKHLRLTPRPSASGKVATTRGRATRAIPKARGYGDRPRRCADRSGRHRRLIGAGPTGVGSHGPSRPERRTHRRAASRRASRTSGDRSDPVATSYALGRHAFDRRVSPPARSRGAPKETTKTARRTRTTAHAQEGRSDGLALCKANTRGAGDSKIHRAICTRFE